MNSTTFSVERAADGARVYRRRELAPEDLARLLAEEGTPVSSSWRGEVTRLTLNGNAIDRIRVRYGSVTRCGRGRLRAAWRGLHALDVQEVAVPRALACVRRSWLGRVREETLLVEAPADYVPLRTAYGETRGSDRHRLIEAVAQLLTVYHRSDAWLAELGPDHILVRRDEGTWRCLLTAVEGIERTGLTPRRVQRNLVSLAVRLEPVPTWLHMARFLRTYDDGRPWRGESRAGLQRAMATRLYAAVVSASRARAVKR